jgi:putative flavoprotein involved in K+ transport
MGAAGDTDVVVIGAGQCGLAVSRELTARGVAHAVIEARDAPGDVWRDRWDSLRLFTPARFNGLPGMAFPGSSRYRPTAAEFADYLDAYAEQFAAPLHCGEKATRLAVDSSGGFSVTTKTGAGDRVWRARRVVVATGGHTSGALPPESASLDARVAQLHTGDYRRPEDLPGRRVLVVGCGASGVQLGVELAQAGRTVTVAGRPTTSIPGPLLKAAGGMWFAFLHRALTRATPLGRKAAPGAIGSGAPLIGISARDLDRHGVSRGPRLLGTVDGLPRLADGRVIEVDAVLWATGYRPSLEWIDALPLDAHGLPEHHRGVSTAIPGLAFLGLPFQFGLTSTLIGGAGRDAAFVASSLAA